MHDQVAGHLRQRIGEEKQPGAQPVGSRGNPQVDIQLMLGQGDVGAVEKAQHVGGNQQWHEFDEQQPVEGCRITGHSHFFGRSGNSHGTNL
ncbi:hypothetical protein D3C77_646010 [compost metagenome]